METGVKSRNENDQKSATKFQCTRECHRPTSCQQWRHFYACFHIRGCIEFLEVGEVKLYKIRDWNDLYENNRSRTVKDLSWVAIPNKHDGENFTLIMAHKDGAKIFSAFVLMVQVASKCSPRGTLIKDNGTPHTVSSLSAKCRCPDSWFEIAFDYLEKSTDWLEIETLADGCQETDRMLTGNCHPTDEERKEGIEKKEGNASNAASKVVIEVPENLKTTEFKCAWEMWLEHLRQKKHKPTDIAKGMQLKKLGLMGLGRAIAAINFSIQQSYQGIYEPSLPNGQAPKSDTVGGRF